VIATRALLVFGSLLCVFILSFKMWCGLLLFSHVFLFNHTRIQPYVDYGGVLFNHFFPFAVPPRYVKQPRAGSVAAPSPPKSSDYPPALSCFHRNCLEVKRPTLTTTPGAQHPAAASEYD